MESQWKWKACPICGSTVADEPNELDYAKEEIASLRATISEVERRERAAVVAWLRDRSAATREWNDTETAVSLTYARAADAIEKGEHRRKGEK